MYQLQFKVDNGEWKCMTTSGNLAGMKNYAEFNGGHDASKRYRIIKVETGETVWPEQKPEKVGNLSMVAESFDLSSPPTQGKSEVF